MQRKVLPTLHYALNPAGLLMLGSAENIARFANLQENEAGDGGRN